MMPQEGIAISGSMKCARIISNKCIEQPRSSPIPGVKAYKCIFIFNAVINPIIICPRTLTDKNATPGGLDV